MPKEISFPAVRRTGDPLLNALPGLSIIRPARDDDVLPAFRRRCLFACTRVLLFAMSLAPELSDCGEAKNGFQTGNISSWRGSLYGH